MDQYGFFVEGLEDLRSLDELDPKIITAAYRAINAATERGRAASAREIRDQVNFPASYVRGKDSRLAVTKKANKSSLEAVITGRRRATSLARFVVGGGRSKQPARVSVKPGRTVEMGRTFLIRLRSGTASLDTASNLGLAIRVPRGTRPSRAYKPVKIDEGLYLLYGPSVDQVFKTVRQDVSPDIATHLEREFFRLLELK